MSYNYFICIKNLNNKKLIKLKLLQVLNYIYLDKQINCQSKENNKKYLKELDFHQLLIMKKY